MRKLIRLATFAGCLFAAAAGKAADGEDWRVFHSEDGGFQVEMPGEPAGSQTIEKSFIGDVTNHLFTVEVPFEEFAVEYSDLPGLALALAGPGTILKKAKEALLKDVRGEELAYRLIRKKSDDRADLSYIGRVGENPGVFGFARFFLRGNRIYVLHVMLSGDRPIDPERVSRFFKSFLIAGSKED